jgi:hypothetical protein
VNTTPAAPAAFRWSQLEAKDYHVYVKNLRAIGCPEATLRAIVTADVDVIYSAKHDEFEKELASLQNSSWSERLASYSSQQNLAARIQDLPGEEAATIAELLGLQAPPPQTADDIAAADSQPAEIASVSVPLILQNIDPAVLNLNSDQSQILERLRQNFVQSIGGTNQDPNDPAYLARWQKAQPEADDMVRTMFGTAAFQAYQMAALKNAQSTATANP